MYQKGKKNASVDAKLLRPSVDTALIEKMSTAGRMLEARAAALSLRIYRRQHTENTRHARAGRG
jgi:hypothetical protein